MTNWAIRFLGVSLVLLQEGACPASDPTLHHDEI
jgi:hypothetical protein